MAPAQIHMINAQDPVETSLKWILILGRIIGLVPVRITFKPSTISKFRWCSLSALYSLILTITLLLVGLFMVWSFLSNFSQYRTILKFFQEWDKKVFFFHISIIYFYFLTNGGKVVSLLGEWAKTTKELNLYSRDTKFPRFCLMLVLIYLSFGIAETTLYNISAFNRQEKLFGNLAFIQRLVYTEADELWPSVPYNPILFSIIFYSMKIGMVSWNFGEILLIALSRAITFKFVQLDIHIKRHLNTWNRKTSQTDQVLFEKKEQIKTYEQIVIGTASVSVSENGTSFRWLQGEIKDSEMDNAKNDIDSFWREIRGKILKLCLLTEEITKFVGPLVLACYGFNIVLIILKILIFLYDSNVRDTSAGFLFTSSIQMVYRVGLVTYFASQVHHSTECIVRTMEFSSDLCYTPTAMRLEEMLRRHPVGVNIFGAFRMTRMFFVSLLSFLFTTEIVMMQAMSATTTSWS